MNRPEQGGYIPPEGEPKKTKKYTEFREEKYEVENVNILHGNDIQPGDRVFIRTQSGNRYMIRMSKSANALKIYNERADRFQTGYLLRDSGAPIAEVGKDFDFIIRVSDDKGQPYHATGVTEIEIRRGIDTAVEDASKGTSFSGMAQSLVDQTHGRRKDN